MSCDRKFCHLRKSVDNDVTYEENKKNKIFFTIKTILARHVQSHAVSFVLQVSDNQKESRYIFKLNLSEKSSN